jgi:hypothetical protein
MAYATEAHLFITDINQSPFNVGTRLALSDFTLEQVAELNLRYGSPIQGSEALGRFYTLLGGCPFLVRRGLHEMVTRNLDIEEFSVHARREDGVFRDHLKRLITTIMSEPSLVAAVRQALERRECADVDSFYRLRSAGVLIGEASAAGFRCELYRVSLERSL